MAVTEDRWGVVYNPRAGSRKVQKRWNEIKAYMESRGVKFDYIASDGFGSIERLVRMLANNGYRTIVAVGGDGAINDAVNGIMSSEADRHNITLGIVPNGIGNDFARYWGLDVDEYRQAIDHIIRHRTRQIDVGCCKYFNGEAHVARYFVNAAYIGLGAHIVRSTNFSHRVWGMNQLAFLCSLIILLFERKLHRVHLRLNHEHIRGNVMTVCIGSARGYGLTPSAVPYNGWLDVSVIYRPQLLQLLSGLWLLLRGRLLNHRMVKPYRTRHIKVLRAENATVTLDGRFLDRHMPLEFTILPEELSIVIPE